MSSFEDVPSVEMDECYKCTHAHVIAKEISRRVKYYDYVKNDKVDVEIPMGREHYYVCDVDDSEWGIECCKALLKCKDYDPDHWYDR